MISVALCTYNGEKFISQQLESIFSQTLAVDEIIICDDGSTDATISIIDAYKSKTDLIQFHRNAETLGVIKNFEKCIGLCNGDIIFLSDQDDIWLPQKTQIMVDTFANDNTLMLLFSDALLINDDSQITEGSLWEKWNFLPPLQREWKDNKKAFAYLAEGHNRVTGATLAFRKELTQYMFPFTLPQHFYHDAWLALLAAGKSGLAFTTEKLIQYRVHAQQQVGFGNGNAYNRIDDTAYISEEDFKQYVHKLFPKYKPHRNNKILLMRQFKRRIKQMLGL